MANCQGSCTNFNAAGDAWFKIDELGLISGDTTTGLWASTLLLNYSESVHDISPISLPNLNALSHSSANLMWTVTIPAALASGNYRESPDTCMNHWILTEMQTRLRSPVIRQELLALHNTGAPQFYPSCSQLTVTGAGTSSPSPEELVAIPGIYSNNTSTMLNIYMEPGLSSYPIAGPAVTKLQAYTGTNAKNLNGVTVTDSMDVVGPSSNSTAPTSTADAPEVAAATPAPVVPTTASVSDITTTVPTTPNAIKGSGNSGMSGMSCPVSNLTKRQLAVADQKRRLSVRGV